MLVARIFQAIHARISHEADTCRVERKIVHATPLSLLSLQGFCCRGGSIVSVASIAGFVPFEVKL